MQHNKNKRRAQEKGNSREEDGPVSKRRSDLAGNSSNLAGNFDFAGTHDAFSSPVLVSVPQSDQDTENIEFKAEHSRNISCLSKTGRASLPTNP